MSKDYPVLDLRNKYYRVSNNIYDYGLDIYELGMYGLFCRYANNDTKESYPSLTHICKALKISRAKAVSTIKSLCEKKIIKKESGNRIKSNRYYLIDLPSSSGELVHEVNQGSSCGELGVVHEVNCKKTYTKKTKEKDYNDGDKSPTKPIDEKERLVKEKSKALADWAFKIADQNKKIPPGKDKRSGYYIGLMKVAKNWVKEYIDDLDSIRKLMNHVEDDDFWNMNFKHLNQFNTIRDQLQKDAFKGNGRRAG